MDLTEITIEMRVHRQTNKPIMKSRGSHKVSQVTIKNRLEVHSGVQNKRYNSSL